jgi:hypothetical protein
MKSEYTTQGSNTYLTFSLSNDEELDTLALNMIKGNSIKGFAPVTFSQLDTERTLRYNITAKVSLADFFSGTVDKSKMLTVFSSIAGSAIDAEDYMLDQKQFVIDMDKIFVDVSTYETSMIYLPLLKSESAEQSKVSLDKFFKDIIFSTKTDTNENKDYVGRMISYLNTTKNFSIFDFKVLVDKLSGTTAASHASGSSGKKTVAQASGSTADQSSSDPLYRPNSVSGSQGGVLHSDATQSAPSARRTQTSSQAPKAVPPQQSFAVPGPTLQGSVQNESDEFASSSFFDSTQADAEKMSILYLMAHYSKENKAIYDAQKNQKSNIQELGTDNDSSAKEMSLPYLLAHYSKENKAIYDAQKPLRKGNLFVSPPKEIPATAFYVPPAPSTETDGSAQSPQSVQAVSPQAGFAVSASSAQGISKSVHPSAVSAAPTAAPYGFQKNTSTTSSPANFGETTILNDGDPGTTVLTETYDKPVAATPYLVRTKNDEKIAIIGETLRIGKDRGYVDYAITDNSTISRSHAVIRKTSNGYVIADTNSTNHTYVDEIMASSNCDIPLEHGARIKLSDEEFVFYTS